MVVEQVKARGSTSRACDTRWHKREYAAQRSLLPDLWRSGLWGQLAYSEAQSPFTGPGVQTEDELDWNNAMAGVRISVEHGFGDLVVMWPFLNAWWKQRIFRSPIGRYYHVAVLLTNALNCFKPNQTA
jgi:hypothetical protein